MPDRLTWERDGRTWPHRDTSRFVQAGGLRWHVQQMGTGPVALLLHGTGAATHSWRGLAPVLATRYTVVAPDLPGHGFTSMPSAARDLSLPGMAQAVRSLITALDLDVALLVGHSAGAAIGARVCLDGGCAPQRLVSLNGAFLPLAGLPGLLFPPVARLMAATPLPARLFAWRASDRAAVERLITGTGSTLDAEGIALYGLLVRNATHAAGALGMMAHWDVRPLQRDLPRLGGRLHLLAGSRDRAVPPEQAQRVQQMVPGSTLIPLPGLGHLAHEERPEAVGRLILDQG
jgi:magnesium chelatase accessory protein